MNDWIERMPGGLRWILLLPCSLGAAFLAGGLVHLLAVGEAHGASSLPSTGGEYAAAFLSGLAYVWACLYVAHSLAPSHQRAVVAVLGALILVDSIALHLLLQGDLHDPAALSGAADRVIGLMLGLLRAGDYGDLRNGNLVKLAGVLLGGFSVLWMALAPKRAERA